MRLIILLALTIGVLISCTTTKYKCVEKTCVHTDQAVNVDNKTQKMYKDIGYRVPIYIPPLIYPEILQLSGLEATLVLEISIDKNGNVQNASVKSSTVKDIFDHYAIEYVKQFKFETSSEETKLQLQRVTYQLL